MNRRSKRIRGKNQPKLNFSSTTPNTREEANDSNMASGTPENSGDGSGSSNAPVLEAIKDLKSEFSNKLDSVMSAIEGIKKEVGEYTERVKGAEIRISSTEDSVVELQSRILSLEKKYTEMEIKCIDFENRARRSNLRLVNLPEKAEGSDACAFLEAWLPQTLGIASKLSVERAHRIGQRKDNNATPRTLIMKFLDYRDKEKVIAAARAKAQILYEDKTVRFYPDMALEVRKKQKEFDSVRQQLREIPGIRQGMLYPAKLLVTYKDKTQAFDKPADVKDFIRRIKGKEKAATPSSAGSTSPSPAGGGLQRAAAPAPASEPEPV